MNTKADSRKIILEAIAGQSEQRRESVSWIKALRDQGVERFLEVGFPTTKDEGWRYTDIRMLAKVGFVPGIPQGPGAPDEALRNYLMDGEAAYRLVFVDGVHSGHLSTIPATVCGLTIGNMADALVSPPLALGIHLGRYVPAESHGFAALNTAFISSGAFIHVAADTVIDRPVHVVYVTTGSGEGRLFQPRNLIVVDDNARITLVEHYVASNGASYLTNTLTELVAGRQAVVDHYRLQEESANSFHVGGLHLHLSKDSRVAANSIDLGAKLARNEVHGVLSDTGSECRLNGIYVLSDRQHIDNQTLIEHVSERSTSRELYKGVLDGRSQGIFHGKVIVHPGAMKSDAGQINKNLLLSKDAEAETQPQLEIYADDVKCFHGATVGQLDEGAMFYLQSRGIGEETARHMLTHAFINDVLDKLQLKEIRDRVETCLSSHLIGNTGECSYKVHAV